MLEMNNVVERVVKEEEQKVLKKIKNYIYDHTAPIGKGFSSLVYSGHNEATNEVIAIKVIELAKIENAVQKYLLNNEINALRALSHPHVIRTVEILMTKHNVYIMTEFCENGDLQQHIKRNGKLSELEALHITKDIVEGYIAIEEKQIVHRDMKTANIFLTATGARIADFGFCDFVNEAKKPPEFYNVGSPAYMSPEIYRENIYSSKSDIWGIGIILFEMLTGDTPDKNLTYFEMSSNLMNGKINSGPNEEIRKILSACFKKDLRERVSSIHLLDMVAKEIARLEGPAKLMVRPHTVGPHHNQSMPASNSKVQGLTHVHPLSPSEVNFRHSQRHMVSSALPLVDDSLRGQSPFKTRFGGIMNREDGREGRNLEPSPLKQGLEKRFTREDDSRAKREAAISLKIKNLTEMLLFLFRQLNFIGDINLERGNFARLILFRHRSYLEGLVEKVVS